MSQKRKKKKQKREQNKAKRGSRLISKVSPVLTSKMKINEYIKAPSFDKLRQLLNHLNSDSDFDNLYADTIDDKSVFNRLTELEIAMILHANERLVECIEIFEKNWNDKQCLTSLNYLFLASIDRSDLDLGLKTLIEIEKRPNDFDKSLLAAYQMMYGLVSGHSSYAEKVAHHTLFSGIKGASVLRLILQVASRIENGHMAAIALSSPFGSQLLGGIGTQQSNRIKKMLRIHLLKILRRLTNE